MTTLKGRVALVTGSSRGIGQAIAGELAHHGAAVAVHGRDQAAVASVVAAIRGDGGTAVGVTGDVTSFADIQAMRRQIEDSLGRWTSWSSTRAEASPRPHRSRTSPRPDGRRPSTATCWRRF